MSFSINACDRRGKLFGACKFEPRYNRDITPANSPAQIEAMADAFSEPLMDYEVESLQSETTTYVGDVCIRCGRWSEKR